MNVFLFLFGWFGEIKGKKIRKALRGKVKNVCMSKKKSELFYW